jgi:hypothetical protein
VAFKTCESAELEAIEPYRTGVHKAAALDKGQFLAFNKNTRAELAGRLF